MHGWRLEQRENGDWACKACYFIVPDEAVARLLERKKYWPGIIVVDEQDPQARCITCGGPVSGMSNMYCTEDNPGMYVPPPPKQITDQRTR
jgi:hypothetical protein